MLGLDTNVLVRLLIEDDAAQTRRARKLVDTAIAEEETVLVSLPVLLETEWVLRSRYEMPPETILGLFRAALEARELAFEDEAAVEEALFNALALFHVTIGMAIAVLADRANHHNILALRSQSLHRLKSALYGKAASMHETIENSVSADGEGIKRGVNLGLVPGVKCTCERCSDIAADERFAEHLDDAGGLRPFAQLRATVAAHQND